MVPLHNHTYFSKDGLSKPIQIADRVVELGHTACACTDHDFVSGHIEFYNAMNGAGIKPLLGIETYQAPISRYENYKVLRDKVTGEKVDNFHLLLLAMNDTGLHNLWAMNTEAHASGFYHSGRVDWELLEKYNDGIIATSACFLGLIQQGLAGNKRAPNVEDTLQKYLNIFGDRFYLELSTYPSIDQVEVNLSTVDLAKTYGVNLVYANDAHYASPDQYELHEAIIALGENKKLKDPTKDEDPKKGRPHHTPDLYIMGEDDTRQHLEYLGKSVVDEALDNSDIIAERCTVKLPESRLRFPIFIPELPYKTSREMLLNIVEDGFERKVEVYPEKDNELYFDRVKQELEVIFGANLVDYFLMVYDYVKWAKDQGMLVGPGRGSVGGSLVAYLIGITQVDPIRYGLIFERFYNAGREQSMPDIDIDFPTRDREKIKKFLTDKYGKDYVVDIGNIIRLQPKSSINDVARVLSIPPKPDVTAINAIIEENLDAGLQPDWEMIFENSGEKLAKYLEKYPQLFEWAMQLSETSKDSKDDHVKTYGTHASGIVVSDEPLRFNLPLRWSSKDKKLVTQWDMRDAEKLGFMKVDVLGLRNLDTLDELNIILKETGKKEIDYRSLQYQQLPDEMWSLLDRGQSVGLFQVEDGGMVKQIAKSMKIRSVEDATVLIAMNRPGPLRSGAFGKYMNGRAGNEPEVDHSLVLDATEDTLGVFLYQEQVIQFMRQIGYSLQEADNIRAIMGKKKTDLLAKEYPLYMSKATQFMSSDIADRIWNDLIGFAKYGFNKSHAVEYAIILLWTLYAKWLHPVEFLVASIRTVDKKNRARYVREAQRMKIPVYAPEFGKSQAQTALYKDGIILGYSDIMGIGLAAGKWLTKNTWIGMTLKDLETLLASDGGKVIQASGSRRVAINTKYIDAMQRLDMFPDALNDYTKEQRMEIEEELLKVAISDDSAKILEEYSDLILSTCVPFSLIDDGGDYTIAGIIRDITHSKTKNNKPYAKIKVIDDSGDELEFFVWNQELKRLDFIFRHRTAGLFNVKRTNYGVSLIDAAILYPKTMVNETQYARLRKATR